MPLHGSEKGSWSEGETPSRLGRALVVDDDEPVRRTTGRVLGMLGYEVAEAPGGHEALGLLEGAEFDVVVTDISMPGMDGIRLLREIRGRDPHVQVILMTGVPTVETAVSALDHGACKYLEKPLHLERLEQAVRRAVSLTRLARMENRAARLSGNTRAQEADIVGLGVSFDRALQSSFVVYQPIVEAEGGAIVGFESLMRSHEAALSQPPALLEAAESLGRLQDLGRVVRDRSVEPFLDSRATETALLFVNLHPADLLDPMLGAPGTKLKDLSSRVVLEITERASLHKIPDSGARVAALRELGFRIAVDDLGAGYAGLSSFAHLAPDFVKLDMSLVRDIDRNDTKRRVVAAMTTLARDLRMTVVAEGVETQGEGETLRNLGCDLLQGFLYALPGPAFPTVTWPHGLRAR